MCKIRIDFILLIVLTVMLLQFVKCASFIEEGPTYSSCGLDFSVVKALIIPEDGFVPPVKETDVIKSIEISIKIKGDPYKFSGNYKFETKASGYNYEFLPVQGRIQKDINCDTYTDTFKITLLPGQFKRADGTINNLISTFRSSYPCYLSFVYSKDADGKSFYLELPKCTSDPPQNVPTISVGDFDKNSYSSEIEISYKLDNFNDVPLITLYSGPAKDINALPGTKQVVSTGKSITGEITGGKYKWVADGTPIMAGGPYYFQVGYQVHAKDCDQWSTPVYSNLEVKNDITGVGPQVKIAKMKNRFGTEIADGGTIEPCMEGPYTLDIYSKIDEIEYPSKITMEINYADNTDQDVKDFYKTSRPSTNIIRTIILNPSAKDSNYTYRITWDGRDDIDNRYILSAPYIIKVTAEFGGNIVLAKSTSTPLAKNVSATKPVKDKDKRFLNMACDYPTKPEPLIGFLGLNYDDSIFVFRPDSVPFLVEEVDSSQKTPNYKFEWIRNFSTIGNVAPISGYGYIKEDEKNGIIYELDMKDLGRRYAVISYLGHAGRLTAAPKCAFLQQPSNYLQSQCGSSYTGACSTGFCFDKTCTGVNRDSIRGPSDTLKWMDDVLLTVLDGCNTATDGSPGDPPSMAQTLVDHGVDCAIGTKATMYLPLMEFWYYHFYDFACRKKQKINIAAENAYNFALKDLVFLFTIIDDTLDPAKPTDLTKILTYFPAGSILPYGNTFKIIEGEPGINGKSIMPPHFGKTHP